PAPRETGAGGSGSCRSEASRRRGSAASLTDESGEPVWKDARVFRREQRAQGWRTDRNQLADSQRFTAAQCTLACCIPRPSLIHSVPPTTFSQNQPVSDASRSSVLVFCVSALPICCTVVGCA